MYATAQLVREPGALGTLLWVRVAGTGWLTAGTMLVAFGTTLAFSPDRPHWTAGPPGARASALSGQSFTLDMGASAGAALSARIAYADFCGFLAVSMAAGTMVLQVTLESAERHHLALDLGPPAEDSAGPPASGPGVGAPLDQSTASSNDHPAAGSDPLASRRSTHDQSWPVSDLPVSNNDP